MAAVTVGTTAVAVAATAPASSRPVLIQNLGSVPVYFGRTNAVTTTSGIRIEPGGHLVLDGDRSRVGSIYLISGTAGQDVRWEVIG